MNPLSGAARRRVARIRSVRRLVAAALVMALALALGPAPAGAQTGAVAAVPPVLVELFTSQGCSACPPADRLLGELAARPGIVAISYAVDYWDYLGWHDVFSSRTNSERQRLYAARFGEGMVYTPQLVVDGRAHVNGADRKAVEAAIARRRQATGGTAPVALSLSAAAGRLRISVGAAVPDGAEGASPRATLWLAEVTGRVEVDVRGGENDGRALAYHNIARDLMPIGEWTGQPIDVALPRDNVLRHGGDGCIAILQQNDGGPVLAAAILHPW